MVDLARAQRQAERIVGPDGALIAPRAPGHGTYSAITYWCCRCGECVAFERAERERRVADRAHNDAIIDIIFSLKTLEPTAGESEEIGIELPTHRASSRPPKPPRTGPRIARRRGSGPRGTVNPTTWRELRARLEDLGCRVWRGKTHYKITLPSGAVNSMPATASDYRSIRNKVLELRRLGVDVRRPASR